MKFLEIARFAMSKVFPFPLTYRSFPNGFVIMKFGGKDVKIPKNLVSTFKVRDYADMDMDTVRNTYTFRGIHLILDGGNRNKKPRKKMDLVKRLECWDKIFGNENYSKGYR